MKTINSFHKENFFLSNFYSAFVYYDGIGYQNNEAAFQAQKCENPVDREQFANLNPSQAKRLGRKIPLRKDWEDIKMQVMQDVVVAKFEQHSDLAKKLLDTQDAHLEADNDWGDRIWGTVDGEGANNLGKILMKVRTELQAINLK